MRGFRMLIAAACLPLVLAAGCGGNNTYNPALVGPAIADFVLAAYHGDANTVGNGQGQTPNSSSNPAGVDANGSTPVTVVVKSINGFTGSVGLSAASPTGNFTVTQPAPATVTVAAGGAGGATITVSPSSGAGPGSTGSVVVTAVSGNTSHTTTLYFKENAATGDFTITAYAGDPNTIGNGTGHTANSANNPAVGLPGATRPITIVVRSTNGFTGTVHLTTGQTSQSFVVSQPSPADVTVPANGTVDTSYNVTLNQNAQNGQTGTTVVTATSGNLTHSATVHYQVQGAD